MIALCFNDNVTVIGQLELIIVAYILYSSHYSDFYSSIFAINATIILFNVCHFVESKELRRLLPDMVRFEPSTEDLELFKDGGVAIIDQWICAHAR